MNKKLLTAAVAAAMIAPTAAMAEAVLYGKLHMSIDWADVDGNALFVNSFGRNPISIITAMLEDSDAVFDRFADRVGVDEEGNWNGFEGWGLNGGGMLPGEFRANRVGIKGSEDLGNGIKAVYQVEFGIRMTEEGFGNAASGTDDAIVMRNSFVGLAGGFGTALVGRHDTPLKISTGKLDLFADTMADNNSTVGFDDRRVDNAIAYISPSLSGFQFMGTMHAGGGSTAGAGANINSDSLAEAYSLAAIYSNGPFYASLAYEVIGEELFMNSVQSIAADNDADEYDKWRLGLGMLDWNGFTLTGIYEQQDFGDIDSDLWQIQAGYSFGNNMVKAMYGSRGIDFDFAGYDYDQDAWSIAFDHNFSKRTKAYVLYTQVAGDAEIDGFSADVDWSGFSVGMIHSF